jgi:hypothetical protein
MSEHTKSPCWCYLYYWFSLSCFHFVGIIIVIVCMFLSWNHIGITLYLFSYPQTRLFFSEEVQSGRQWSHLNHFCHSPSPLLSLSSCFDLDKSLVSLTPLWSLLIHPSEMLRWIYSLIISWWWLVWTCTVLLFYWKKYVMVPHRIKCLSEPMCLPSLYSLLFSNVCVSLCVLLLICIPQSDGWVETSCSCIFSYLILYVAANLCIL